MDINDLITKIIAGLISGLLVFFVTKYFTKKEKRGNLIKVFKNRKTLLLLYYFIAILIFFLITIFIKYYNKQNIIKSKVETLIHSNIWMAYDPSGYNPLITKIPSAISIEKDLKIIKKIGFTGIITFNCNDYMDVVPEISKKIGLKIILGIWNPNNNAEIANAIALQNFVDGYCIGHNGLKYNYSLQDLKNAIITVRNATCKPTSTTESIKYYIKDKELINIVDWIFPDGNLTIPDSVIVKRDVSNLFLLAKKLDEANLNNKPILLKMIIYPYFGIKNASEANQSQFFSELLKGKKDAISNMPSNVSISFYGLYDPYWKISPPYYEWEPYTGLINTKGEPRQALKIIMKMIK